MKSPKLIGVAVVAAGLALFGLFQNCGGSKPTNTLNFASEGGPCPAGQTPDARTGLCVGAVTGFGVTIATPSSGMLLAQGSSVTTSGSCTQTPTGTLVQITLANQSTGQTVPGFPITVNCQPGGTGNWTYTISDTQAAGLTGVYRLTATARSNSYATQPQDQRLITFDRMFNAPVITVTPSTVVAVSGNEVEISVPNGTPPVGVVLTGSCDATYTSMLTLFRATSTHSVNGLGSETQVAQGFCNGGTFSIGDSVPFGNFQYRVRASNAAQFKDSQIMNFYIRPTPKSMNTDDVVAFVNMVVSRYNSVYATPSASCNSGANPINYTAKLGDPAVTNLVSSSGYGLWQALCAITNNDTNRTECAFDLTMPYDTWFQSYLGYMTPRNYRQTGNIGAIQKPANKACP